jgi:UDP-N-acetylglucosamine--N-acetylmuramyl-(pentapeptide) pyrophosphoryl-undecaprenol N-acetylglucosamine transferase
MKVLVVGGGSGGHITPAVAVVREILEKRPRTKVEFWTDKKYYKNVVKITTEIGVHWGDEDKLGSAKNPYIQVLKIKAGKFHRYAGLTFKDYFDDGAKTLRDVTLGNFFGFIGFTCGIFQAFFRLLGKKNRPDVIFLKGGFVGLPVGIVAKWFKIPYVIHESDAVPGLANRMLMKRAKVVAMGSPFDDGIKGRENWTWVGIPVAAEYKKISNTTQKQLKKEAGFDPEKPLVMVTGGSQGAEHINLAMREILPEMLKFTSVGLVAGRKHYEDMVDLKKYEEWDKAKLQSNFRMWEFSPVMNELLGAADVVISRAGATTIAELAVLSKPVILVPFEKLPGSHQLKNAQRLERAEAAVVVPDSKMEEDPTLLLESTRTLIRSPKKREELAEKLHAESKTDAAERLADILVEIATGAN